MPSLSIFGLGFKENIAIFEINAAEFNLLKSLVQKQNFLNLWLKMSYLSKLPTGKMKF